MDEQLPVKKFLTFSVVLHLALLTVLVLNLEFNSKMPVLENSNVIQASVLHYQPIPNKIVVKEIKETPPPPPPPRVEPEVPPPKVLPIIKPVQQKEAIIIPDKKLEKIKKEEMIKKQLLAELKKQKEMHAKQQRDIQKAFENEMKELNAKNLQQQMLMEQKRLADERTLKMNGEVNKYKALILQSISRHWLVPPNVNKKLSAQLLIRVAPGGTVLDVQLTKSSGDDALDRSARAAVFKASPLPVPNESDVFESFRQFVLKVKPENVLTNDNWLS